MAPGAALVVALCALAVAAPAARAEAMHCGRSIVVAGDSPAEVLRKCGPPTRRQSLKAGATSPAARPQRSARRGRQGKSSAAGSRGAELWIYDLGSRHLVRYLTFERGRLARIDFGGYGR
jgi:hypothetical protein